MGIVEKKQYKQIAMKLLNIVFMGTPDFALAPLKELHETGHTIKAIYCQPPRQKGRGHHVQKNPTHMWGEENHIPVLTPLNFKSPDAIMSLQAFNPDVIVVVAYGMILPSAVLNIPPMGCINIHASLLPRWRGAAPIQRAIMAGDAQTGLTTMYMDQGLDTGDILEQIRIPIYSDTTTHHLYENMKKVSGQLIVSTLHRLTCGSITPIKQPLTGVSYAHKLGKEEGFLDYTQTAAILDCQIRGLVPQISVWFESLPPMRFKIISAKPLDINFSCPVGSAIIQDNQFYIQCGQGALCVKTVQPEGKLPLSIGDFLNGYRRL